MTPSQISIGTAVTRTASDYTDGRTGSVIEIDNIRNRARVMWTAEKNGTPMRLRTWVRFQDLKATPAA